MTTVNAVAGVLLAHTQGLPTGNAVFACATRRVQPGDGDARADGECNARADTFDDADTFVSRHERRSRLQRPIAMCGVDIVVTESARFEADDDLPGTGLGGWPVFDNQGFPNSWTTATRITTTPNCAVNAKWFASLRSDGSSFFWRLS